MANMPNGMTRAIPQAYAQPATSGPLHGNTKKQSDLRFRSFAERYLIARASYFRLDPSGLAEDTWSCILDAKRAYRMIQRTGENIEPEDGIF